ncbi:YjdJ family protein [Bacillus thuringiensis]|uniref:YjdJ family protein n=1 Tax=Bacillus thuringiensis TaxID=1428 RepID=UPI00350F2117
MTINQMVQLGSSFMLFITSALMSWYQGSNLIDNPDEWKYSAKFTNYFKGTVSNYQDIYQIDFFIYAAKFYPTAFIVMLVSLLYMLILILYILFSKKIRRFKFIHKKPRIINFSAYNSGYYLFIFVSN